MNIKNISFSFLNPELDALGKGYQIIQSKIAIGSGGIFGKVFNWEVSRLDFYRKTYDFVFTLISEEMGFVGSMLVLILYFVINIILIKFLKKKMLLIKFNFWVSFLFFICFLILVW